MENAIQTYDDWLKSLPVEIEKNYKVIENICENVNSLDLISNISFYNSLQNPEEYVDDRGDKHFFIAEAIAIQCLKKPIVEVTTLDNVELQTALKNIQDATLKYCSLIDALNMGSTSSKDDVLSEISMKLQRDSTHIRNPGHPKHHLYFSEEMLEPLSSYIEKKFGFTHLDSIIIRDEITDFLNEKYSKKYETLKLKGNFLAREIIKLKNNRDHDIELLNTIENLEKVAKFSDSDIIKFCLDLTSLDFFRNLSDIYCFTATELSIYLKLETDNVTKFLELFSTTFNSIGSSENIFQPINIFTKKPLIKHGETFIIPSLPLFIWSVEEFYKDEFKKDIKAFAKFTLEKHDYLLNKGMSYFETLLPGAKIYKNIFYEIEENRYETDGLVIYDNNIFIIEAKANFISDKAKKGHILKAKDHINDIIRESNRQANRLIDYLSNSKVQFFHSNGKKQEIDLKENSKCIVVTLTLESVGSIVPLLKTTDHLKLFNNDYFPWIISLYDLVVIADFFDTPSVLFHYLNSRMNFLCNEKASIYEELDLIGYFIKYGGLPFQDSDKSEGRLDSADFIYFEPESDFINNYYMFKFSQRRNIKKADFFSNLIFKEFIEKIDKSSINRRIEVSTFLLKISNNSKKVLMQYIKKCKKSFKKDRELHDATMYFDQNGGTGFTYMIANDENYLNEKMQSYIMFKKKQMGARKWIGVGEFQNKLRVINIIEN